VSPRNLLAGAFRMTDDPSGRSHCAEHAFVPNQP
jgi:hypothetical protein